MAVGAATRLMDEAWWIPVYRLESARLTCGQFFDRAFPGCMIVNRQGARFMNDAANYDETGRAMANAAATPDEPSFYIFDEHYRRNYLAGPMLAMPRMFDAMLPGDVKRIVVKADSLAELAAKLGIDPAGLRSRSRPLQRISRKAASTRISIAAKKPTSATTATRTARRTAPSARSASRRSMPSRSTPAISAPRAAWRPIATRKSSMRQARPIAGLYAAGNSAASMMGRTYPAGGVTIGPAMVFGARAAMHIAGTSLFADSFVKAARSG